MRARVVDHVARLDAREAHRVAEHVDEVVLHQQRLVFVDGQADVALRRIDDQVDARALDAGARDQLVDALEQARVSDRRG